MNATSGIRAAMRALVERSVGLLETAATDVAAAQRVAAIAPVPTAPVATPVATLAPVRPAGTESAEHRPERGNRQVRQFGDPQSLAAAFVAAEVLAPPVALRDR